MKGISIRNWCTKRKENLLKWKLPYTSLTGIKQINPMPEVQNDMALSNQFAEFFSDKILKNTE